MTVAIPAPKYPGRILPVTLPAGPGGVPVTVGGQNALPLLPEGERPHPHAVGMEVRTGAEDLPPALAGTIGAYA
ncbi:MAG: hypothetical protein HZB86_03695, partial [Deltaproteobacteria bacterium]|nr:hypothetical protein [Deltaproteobacteria bacterium]